MTTAVLAKHIMFFTNELKDIVVLYKCTSLLAKSDTSQIEGERRRRKEEGRGWEWKEVKKRKRRLKQG